MVKYDVPFYRQSLDFTCGPACLMMALRFFDKSIKLNRGVELEIWRESNLVEVWATDRYGLALASHRRGFPTTIMTNSDDFGYAEVVPKYRKNVDRKWLLFFLSDIKRKCQDAGIPEVVKGIGVREIRRHLDEGGIPIVLVDARLLSKEHLPHWIVVKGYEGKSFFINNPLDHPRKRKEKVDSDIMKKSLGFMGYRNIVTVRPPDKE